MISKIKKINYLCALIVGTLLASPILAEPNTQSTTASSNASFQSNSTQSNDFQADENGFYVGAQLYVSDKVNALLRYEPAPNVRSAGNLHPGDSVEFRGYSRDKRYSQVISGGQTYWMRTGDLQSTPAAINQLEKYKQRIEELNTKLQDLQKESAELMNTDQGQEITKLNAELNALKDENTTLKQTLAEQQDELTRLNEQQNTQNQEGISRELDMQMRWWLQGALIALGGAIAGIIFIMLPRPRRQKNNRY